MNRILERIKERPLIFDGAMGTQLQKLGLKPGQAPESVNFENPGLIAFIHEGYLKAGAESIITNTFGANEKKLGPAGYTVEEVIGKAFTIAKGAAAPHNAFVGFNMGPIGQLLEPMGKLSFEEAYDIFARQIKAAKAYDPDFILIQTMTDLYETKAALLAAKENCDVPVFCTMSFEKDMRTFTGCSISSMAITLEGLGADAIGINCSLGPAQILPMAKELVKWTNLPLIIQPNAGLPSVAEGKTLYDVTPDGFAEIMKEYAEIGFNIFGGCCGTDPDYIAALKEAVGPLPLKKREKVSVCALCTPTVTLPIEGVRVIGERINPTGKKLFKEALIKGDIDYIVKQGVLQANAGADILDVNVGLPEIDEKAMMVKVVKALQAVLDLPLQIDSADPEVISAALRIYNGKPIVNSVSGEKHKQDKILPAVKKYGAAVVGLCMDGAGIKEKAEERIKIARSIMQAARSYDIAPQDIYIDCLTLTASAQQEEAYETVRALSMVKRELGAKTVLGVSNVSFGLPARETINAAFFALALDAGLDLPILNPNSQAMMDTLYAYRVIKNIDKGAGEYIRRLADRGAQAPVQNKIGEKDIAYSIQNGLKAETAEECRRLLADLDPLEVVNSHLIPALDAVGKKYETGALFLPQLILAAETAKEAFEVVKEAMKNQKTTSAAPVKIILATVAGDIHDIGKNIVKVVLENYGFDIIDLGRDVPAERVVEQAKLHNPQYVGLSALMTTTLKSMEETIAALRKEKLNCKIMVGGAVLTPEYAKKIGADYYAKDARSAVNVIRARGAGEKKQ